MHRRMTACLLWMLLVGWALPWLSEHDRWAWAAEPLATADAFEADQFEFFEKRIRPLLHHRCYKCHGPDADPPKGGLRLDSRAALLAGGDTGPAIQAGNAEQSLLIDSVRYGELYQMPPKSKLPAGEIAALVRWVEMGAPWPGQQPADTATANELFDIPQRVASHWCWQPLSLAAAPTVANRAWPKQDLDRFVLARLEEKGISPSPPVGRRALIRRVYFDLIGLPPPPSQVKAFLADQSPKAFEKVVDQLLDSPHYGERWARHWMDLVRYAETYGHEFDYEIPHAVDYRDYLIRAFNADVPYDQFVVEHLAGDLLPQPRLHPSQGYNESIIGTGFWWLGEATHAPVDVRGDEAGRIDNQLDVMSKTFLALTVACARCHDHKFDAISTRDYYGLAGFLQSSRRQRAMLDSHQIIAQRAQRLREVKAKADAALSRTAPPSDRNAADQFARHLLASQRSSDADDSALLQRWVVALRDANLGEASHPLRAWHELASGNRDDLKGDPKEEDFRRLRRRLREELDEATRARANAPLLADFQADSYDGWFVAGEAFGNAPTRAGQCDAPSDGVQLALPGVAHSGSLAAGLHGVLRSPTFTITHKNLYYRIAGRGGQVRLVVDGYFMDAYSPLLFRGLTFDVNTEGKFIWHRQAEDLGRYVGHCAYLEIIDRGDGYVAVDEIRFSNDEAPPEAPSRLAAEALTPTTRSMAELAAAYGRIWRAALQRWRRGAIDGDDARLINWALKYELFELDRTGQSQFVDAIGRIQQQTKGLPAPKNVLAMTDGSGENERVFIRGNHRTLGDEAPRQWLAALGGDRLPVTDRGSGRLALARQIVDPQNPLTSRVMANRVWHHLLGRGIVSSVDNFGVLGEPPTHPELLDFLAAQLMRDGWSIKRLIRSILLSSTYQMSSAADGRGDRLDPQNLLLHRANIRRLQSEAVRDAILAVSGRLDRTLFGPSVPVHLTDFMQGRGRPKKSGPLDGDGRRSIYTAVRRNFLPSMMLVFDTPIPFNSVGRRNVSNVPAQALILMNDRFVVRQAGVWAERLLSHQGQTPRQRIESIYLDAFARQPTQSETEAVLAFLSLQAKELGLSAEEARSDLRVWSDLCHVVMNVKEFIYIQ